MKKYALLIPAMVISLFLSSCQSDLAINEALDYPLVSRSPQGIPFHGTYTTTSTVLSPPPLLMQQIEGSGQASHLGRSTFSASTTLDMTTPPPFALSGTGVFRAANGDELLVSFTGTATPNGEGANDVVIYNTVTGGTGRFAAASGSFTGYTTAVPGMPNGEVRFEGQINF